MTDSVTPRCRRHTDGKQHHVARLSIGEYVAMSQEGIRIHEPASHSKKALHCDKRRERVYRDPFGAPRAVALSRCLANMSVARAQLAFPAECCEVCDI